MLRLSEQARLQSSAMESPHCSHSSACAVSKHHVKSVAECCNMRRDCDAKRCMQRQLAGAAALSCARFPASAAVLHIHKVPYQVIVVCDEAAVIVLLGLRAAMAIHIICIHCNPGICKVLEHCRQTDAPRAAMQLTAETYLTVQAGRVCDAWHCVLHLFFCCDKDRMEAAPATLSSSCCALQLHMSVKAAE